MKRYRLTTIAKAKSLIASKAIVGDNGFKGQQLVLWNTMKKENLKALRLILANKEVNDFEDPECPRDEGRYEWVGPVTKAMKEHTAHDNCTLFHNNRCVTGSARANNHPAATATNTTTTHEKDERSAGMAAQCIPAAKTSTSGRVPKTRRYAFWNSSRP